MLFFYFEFGQKRDTYSALVMEFPLFRINSLRHICISKLIIIGSDNGLSPEWRQAVILTNAGILLIEPLGKNSMKFLLKLKYFYWWICIWSVVCQGDNSLSQPQCFNSLLWILLFRRQLIFVNFEPVSIPDNILQDFTKSQSHEIDSLNHLHEIWQNCFDTCQIWNFQIIAHRSQGFKTARCFIWVISV